MRWYHEHKKIAMACILITIIGWKKYNICGDSEFGGGHSPDPIKDLIQGRVSVNTRALDGTLRK